MEILLATRNEGKVREIKQMLEGLGLKILLPGDFPNLPEIRETGTTLTENAILKAKELSELTGKLTLADDSGLEVEALGGEPGVRSARFAGESVSYEDNNRKLLELLKDLPLSRRKAGFKCVMAMVSPRGWTKVTEGECLGVIGLEPRGKSGFGYDPIFLIPEYNRTFGQLPLSVKNRISHRYKALRKMRKIIEKMTDEGGKIDKGEKKG